MPTSENISSWDKKVGETAMLSYQDAYRALSVPKLARDVLSGSLDEELTLRVAINWIGRNFAKEEITFTELRPALLAE
jgi:hypothetical protein